MNDKKILQKVSEDNGGVFDEDTISQAVLLARADEQRKLGMYLALCNIEVKSFKPLFEIDLSFIQREAHQAQKAKTLREVLEWLDEQQALYKIAFEMKKENKDISNLILLILNDLRKGYKEKFKVKD